MAGKKKAEHRTDADLIATYGPILPITPSLILGLWLNYPRIQLRKATEYALGVWAASTSDPLPLEWFDAIAMDASEADRLESAGNLRRGR
jgi:hypothetical protein